MRAFVVGGSGFIGTHLCNRLYSEGHAVKPFDLREGNDARNIHDLVVAMRGSDIVYHLASNPDIAKAATEPTIDFHNGTAITQNVVEAARLTGVQTIVYASGSGVYGDGGPNSSFGERGPFEPVSPYGASKLAGEALVSAYCHMFGMRGVSFRFANVVGPNQTHGVGHDFINRLKADPTVLHIMGDGQQTKSYIHVDDVLDAIGTVLTKTNRTYDVYNVATSDRLTVREIADMASDVLGVSPRYEFTGGSAGWPGDVPRITLTCDWLRWLGWSNRYSSRQAMRLALESMA